MKIDAAGEFYWNDEFMFETDPTSTITANREAMWNANDLKLQSGAFGQLGDLETALSYWTLQEKANYPNAGAVKALIQARLQEQKQVAQAMQAQQMQNLENVPSNALQGGVF